MDVRQSLAPGLPTWTMKHLWIRWPLMLSDSGSCPKFTLPSSIQSLHPNPIPHSLSPTLNSHSRKWGLSLTAPWPEPRWVTLRPGRYTGVHRTYCSNHRAAHCLPKGRTVSTARNQDSLHPLRWEGWGSVSPRGTLLSIRKTCKYQKNLPECNWGLWNERIII